MLPSKKFIHFLLMEIFIHVVSSLRIPVYKLGSPSLVPLPSPPDCTSNKNHSSVTVYPVSIWHVDSTHLVKEGVVIWSEYYHTKCYTNFLGVTTRQIIANYEVVTVPLIHSDVLNTFRHRDDGEVAQLSPGTMYECSWMSTIESTITLTWGKKVQIHYNSDGSLYSDRSEWKGALNTEILHSGFRLLYQSNSHSDRCPPLIQDKHVGVVQNSSGYLFITVPKLQIQFNLVQGESHWVCSSNDTKIYATPEKYLISLDVRIRNTHYSSFTTLNADYSWAHNLFDINTLEQMLEDELELIEHEICVMRQAQWKTLFYLQNPTLLTQYYTGNLWAVGRIVDNRLEIRRPEIISSHCTLPKTRQVIGSYMKVDCQDYGELLISSWDNCLSTDPCTNVSAYGYWFKTTLNLYIDYLTGAVQSSTRLTEHSFPKFHSFNLENFTRYLQHLPMEYSSFSYHSKLSTELNIPVTLSDIASKVKSWITGIWGSALFSLLGCALTAILVYFICKCCTAQFKKNQEYTYPRITMWAFEEFDLAQAFDEGEGTSVKAPPPPLSTHCNVPLKYNKQRAAILKPSYGQYCPLRNQYKREYNAILEIAGKTTPDYFDLCHLQYDLLNHFCPESNTFVSAEWDQQLRVSSHLWREQSAALLSLVSETLSFPDYSLTEDQLMILKPYYLRKSFFEEGVLSSGSDSYMPTSWWVKKDVVSYYRDFSLLIACTKNLALIVFRGSSVLVSRDHLLILSDLAAQRYILLKYALLGAHHVTQPFISPGLLTEYLEQGDLILKRGGNESYKIISTIEPLCLSYLVGDLPVGTRLGKSFKDLIISEIMRTAELLNVVEETRALMSLLEFASQVSPSVISELFGLYRIWGHPTLEPLEGATALKKIATKVRITNQDLVNRITNKFKEEFICRYIAKEHVWPDLNLTKLPSSNVIVQAYHRKAPFPNKHKDYRRSDLDLVSFHQIFPVDPKFDLIELIADKALSLLTPDLIQHVIGQHNCGQATERSVLINWLKSPIQDPEEFLRYIDSHGFPDLEKSNGVREKEREEKLRPRMFGLMTLFKRMYIVLTEALLAEHLIPFFPEITMIDDELSLDKKRFMFNLRSENIDQIIISLDFSKWNTNMRKNETYPMFKIFDQLFGFSNCFTRTHEMFEGSAIYLLNGTYLPQTVEGSKLKSDLGCWYGHLGGIEGLRQKGWTIWTVSLILLAAENLNFFLALMGQGDNQILRLRFPANFSLEESESTMYEFLKNLDNILSKVGPPLKLEETWASRDLYVYGKYLVYKGVALPMSGKRIARIFRLSNEDYPTLESALSSATANLTAALGCHYSIGPLFILYLSEIVGTFQLGLRSTYLQHYPLQKTFSAHSSIRIPGEIPTYHDVPNVTTPSGLQKDSLLEALCLFPRALGGFPVMNLFDCLLRGFPDEVTFAVASLKIIYQHASPHQQRMIERMCSPPLSPYTNFQLLAEHPTVLNLEVPPAPGESRRNLIIDFLKTGDLQINRYVSTFIDLLESEEDKTILSYLTTVTPFNPRILSVFMGATAEARARHVAGKLQKTKTIATVARSLSSINIYAKIIDSEKNHCGSVFRILFKDHTNTVKWNPLKCSVSHCDQLRNLGWQKEIVGVNCVPPQEFMNIELNIPHQGCESHYELSKGYVGVRLDPSYLLPSFNSPLIKGSFPPYRGSVTRQKVSGYGDKIAAQAEPIIQKVLRLYSLVGWGIPRSGHLHQLCDKMLERHTDLPSENLCPPDEEITGSVHHRLQDMRTGHGGSTPTLPNYGSKLMFDTFPLVAYSKGSKNVNLMFQSFMSAAVVLLGEIISYGWRSAGPVIHIHVASSCCVQELKDELCESPIPPIMTLQQYPTNPYLYVKKEKILLLMEKGLRFEVNRNLGPDKNSLFHRYHSLLAEECFHLLSPHTWDRSLYGFKTTQLVINWVLPCNTSLLLVSIALRLCVHYLGAIRERHPEKFLSRVSERIERSPLDHWKSLAALVFAPDLSHHLVGKGIYSRVSGNPVCSETSLSLMLKEAVVSVVNNWAHDKKSRLGLRYVDCYARPYCGLSQHPALLLLGKDWIMGETNIQNVRDLRYYVINNLTKQPLKSSSADTELLGNHYVSIGKTRITGETLDYLCKQVDTYHGVYTSPSRSVNNLPEAGEVLCSFNRESVVRTHHRVTREWVFSKSVSYANHLLKIASTPTTGTYKCLSFLRHLPLINPKYIACLGDGSGGFSLGSLLYYPNAKVFYNTLISKEIPIQQSSPIPFVPALAGRKDLEARIVGLDITTDLVSDLTHQNLGSILHTRISSEIELVMCDAEFTKEDPTDKGISLIKGVLNIGVLLNAKFVVFKTYLKQVSLIALQISLLLSHYDSVQVYRSAFSSTYNTEVYLIASNLCRDNLLKETGPGFWSGPILKPVCFDKLYELRDYLLDPALSDISDVATAYTRLISTDETISFLSEIRRYLPFVVSGTSYHYPIEIVKWIHETSSEWAGAPQLTRIRLETTTLHHTYLRRWSLAFLIAYLLTDVSEGVDSLQSMISHGYLLWFRTQKKGWDLSLCLDPLPSTMPLLGYKQYSLSDILNEGDKKLIFKLAGICLHLNISFTNINSTTKPYLRGSLHWSLRPIRSEEEAEIPWIKTNVQYGTQSTRPKLADRKKKPLPAVISRKR